MAAEIAKEAVDRQKTVIEVAEERGLLSKEQIGKILDPARMTEPGISGKK